MAVEGRRVEPRDELLQPSLLLRLRLLVWRAAAAVGTTTGLLPRLPTATATRGSEPIRANRALAVWPRHAPRAKGLAEPGAARAEQLVRDQAADRREDTEADQLAVKVLPAHVGKRGRRRGAPDGDKVGLGAEGARLGGRRDALRRRRVRGAAVLPDVEADQAGERRTQQQQRGARAVGDSHRRGAPPGGIDGGPPRRRWEPWQRRAAQPVQRQPQHLDRYRDDQEGCRRHQRRERAQQSERRGERRVGTEAGRCEVSGEARGHEARLRAVRRVEEARDRRRPPRRERVDADPRHGRRRQHEAGRPRERKVEDHRALDARSRGELGLGRAGQQAGHCHARRRQLASQRASERRDERATRGVGGRLRERRVGCERAREEQTTVPLRREASTEEAAEQSALPDIQLNQRRQAVERLRHGRTSPRHAGVGDEHLQPRQPARGSFEPHGASRR